MEPSINHDPTNDTLTASALHACDYYGLRYAETPVFLMDAFEFGLREAADFAWILNLDGLPLSDANKLASRAQTHATAITLTDKDIVDDPDLNDSW